VRAVARWPRKRKKITPSGASAMKLGGFTKVPESSRAYVKRHVDRTSYSGFTRGSFLAYSYALASRP